MNKQVLQFILEEENPNGIIECSVDDWFGISYKIPRNKLKEASTLDYINNTGVYILFGDDENTAEKIAYIGEAEDIYNRLSQHNKNKDYWNECIVFVSKDNSDDPIPLGLDIDINNKTYLNWVSEDEFFIQIKVYCEPGKCFDSMMQNDADLCFMFNLTILNFNRIKTKMHYKMWLQSFQGISVIKTNSTFVENERN